MVLDTHDCCLFETFLFTRETSDHLHLLLSSAHKFLKHRCSQRFGPQIYHEPDQSFACVLLTEDGTTICSVAQVILVSVVCCFTVFLPSHSINDKTLSILLRFFKFINYCLFILQFPISLVQFTIISHILACLWHQLQSACSLHCRE